MTGTEQEKEGGEGERREGEREGWREEGDREGEVGRMGKVGVSKGEIDLYKEHMLARLYRRK